MSGSRTRCGANMQDIPYILQFNHYTHAVTFTVNLTTDSTAQSIHWSDL